MFVQTRQRESARGLGFLMHPFVASHHSLLDRVPSPTTNALASELAPSMVFPPSNAWSSVLAPPPVLLTRAACTDPTTTDESAVAAKSTAHPRRRTQVSSIRIRTPMVKRRPFQMTLNRI